MSIKDDKEIKAIERRINTLKKDKDRIISQKEQYADDFIGNSYDRTIKLIDSEIKRLTETLNNLYD